MSVLFINACVRDNSRTKILADNFLKGIDGEIEVLNLADMNLLPLNGERLKQRENLIAQGNLSDGFFDLARQFSNANEIVISAPFWDLSFPSLLKIYFENITVSGITFKYNLGIPIGLCKAEKLTYITTSGGKIFEDYGFSYVKSICKNFYGIKQIICYRAENLDVNLIEGEQVLSQPIITVK